MGLLLRLRDVNNHHSSSLVLLAGSRWGSWLVIAEFKHRAFLTLGKPLHELDHVLKRRVIAAFPQLDSLIPPLASTFRLVAVFMSPRAPRVFRDVYPHLQSIAIFLSAFVSLVTHL